MGYEIRDVPEGWEHPKAEDGTFKPILPEDMPKENCTHVQVYESITEGTPRSPIFKDRETLGNWLAESEEDFPSCWTRAGADYFIETGFLPTMMMTEFGLLQGGLLANFLAEISSEMPS